VLFHNITIFTEGFSK